MNERVYVLRNDEIKANCLKYVASLPVSEKPLEVKIKPFKRKRRVEANNYLWAMYTQIATEAYRMKITDQYYPPEYFHEYFKKEFLGKKVVIDGDIHLLPESTADKSVVEFMDFCTQVECWAAEHNIIIARQV